MARRSFYNSSWSASDLEGDASLLQDSASAAGAEGPALPREQGALSQITNIMFNTIPCKAAGLTFEMLNPGQPQMAADWPCCGKSALC